MSNRYVGPSGPRNAKILVIGEAPGKEEEKEGRPFVGWAGKMLREKMFMAGIDPDECFLTNLSKFRPPGNQLSAWYLQDKPIAEELIDGMMELRREIEEVKPNIIVTCGAYPLHALTGLLRYEKKYDGLVGVQEWRGCILESSRLAPGRKLVSTLHPSFIVRGNWADGHLLAFDLARAAEQSAFPDVRRPTPELICDAQGMERIECRDRLMREGPFITFDIEYSRRTKKLYCCGFTSGSGWAFNIVPRGDKDIAFIRDILLSGKGLCAQNGIFDASILEWHHDIPCIERIVHDTLIASHAAYLEYPKDLGFLCRMYTEQPNYWSKFDRKWWARLDRAIGEEREAMIKEMLVYNCHDNWVTHATAEAQIADELTDQNVRWVFEHEMALMKSFWKMSKRGIRIDTERMAQLKVDLKLKEADAQAEIDSLASRHINVKSGPQVSKWLVDELNFPLRKKTPKGKWFSNDDITLSEVGHECNELQRHVITLLRSVRKARDLQSKFADMDLEDDGFTRSTYNPAGTTTGRAASKKFYPTERGVQGQNIPTEPEIRSVYVPRRAGFEFGVADLERAESLVVAQISGDPFMLMIHGPGMDAHIATAAVIYDMHYNELMDEYKNKEPSALRKREMGKRGNHALNYMMGWMTFQKKINALSHKTGIYLTAAEAKEILVGVRRSRPLVVSWWDDVKAAVTVAPHTLHNLHGRPRVFFDGPYTKIPDAVAYIPQSTVGDTLNIGLLCCEQPEDLPDIVWDRLPNDRHKELAELGFELLGQVHDSVNFQYPIENRELILPLVREALTVPLEIPKRDVTFTIPVELKIGPSWGEVELYTDDLKEKAA